METSHLENKVSATKPTEILAESSGNVPLSGDQQNGARIENKEVKWGGATVEDQDENDEPQDGVEHTEPPEEAPKKKKKKKKSRSKAGKPPKPTGFEEYYVDPPVTPDEYTEERSLYDLSRTFVDRIQTAIQRYSSKRKFDSTRKDVFDKYMSFGGVTSGSKMFGGGEVGVYEQTADDIAELKATHYVGDDIDKDFVVDFDGMLKAFLSSRLPVTFDLSIEGAINNHVAVIRNFLNYLLHHDVCPEYADQIQAARRTCDAGQAQLWLIEQSHLALPGDFNKACSTIFGGYYEPEPIEDRGWAEKMGLSKGFEHAQASQILQGGLAAHGDEALCNLYNSQVANKTAKRVNTFKALIEITALEFASREIEELYNHPSMSGCKPIGKLKAQTWNPPGDTLDDLTEEEEAQNAREGPKLQKFEFWVENETLDKLFVGMKLEIKVHELSFGVRYFDSISATLCSFYSEVPNELMIGWKEHKYLPPRKVNEPDTLEAWVPDYAPGEEDLVDPV